MSEPFLGHAKAQFERRQIEDINPLSGTRKMRTLYVPNKSMRNVHGQLIAAVRRLPIDLSSATAFRPGWSPMRNVTIHVSAGGQFYFLIDLARAYEHIDLGVLGKILWQKRLYPRMVYTQEEMVDFIKRYCAADEGGLATGAPASPDLFNLFCAETVDGALREYCARYSITYTRYCDDLVFSSKDEIGYRKRQQLLASVREAGFVVNDSKCRYWRLSRGPALVTGYRVYGSGDVRLPSSYVRHLRGLLYLARIGHGRRELTVAQLAGKFSPLIALSRSRWERHMSASDRKLVREFKAFVKHARD